MSVLINNVIKNSLAQKNGIKTGEKLLTVNDNPINDVLDFGFYTTDTSLKLQIEDINQQVRTIIIKKSEYQDIGLEFQTYLMDKQHSCTNKCVFCFIDQLPDGMRDTLYFKDDDDRLSFIFGNYITLTNMKQEEIDRIIKMHISPINISVHTTNPELRVKMLKNKFAGEVLKYIPQMAKAGIKINCQLVLCPGINDADELIRSLEDLGEFYPSVVHIACVPLGMTMHRDGLDELEPYTVEKAREAINIINSFGDKWKSERGERIAYPADEMFIKAKLPIPDYSYYDDFTQLSNGMGMIALQKYEFMQALEEIEPSSKVRKITIATGIDAQPYIKDLVDELNKKWHNLNCQVIAIKNIFFGETITVAGLITGGDLINQLEQIDIGEELLLPKCMLRHEEDKFLDDITLEEVKKRLNIDITLCENDGYELLYNIIGQKEDI